MDIRFYHEQVGVGKRDGETPKRVALSSASRIGRTSFERSTLEKHAISLRSLINNDFSTPTKCLERANAGSMGDDHGLKS